MESSPSPVPWSQIAAFVRQLSHDVRNDLNALSLEAALLKELVTDPEAVVSANRIQSQLRETAARLKDLSSRFALPVPQIGNVSLKELSVHLQSSSDTKSLNWKPVSSSREVHTDPAALARAFRELAVNAQQHGPGKADAELTETSDGGAVLILREPDGKEHPWPHTPFEKLKAGRYGAGLYLAAAILQSIGVTIVRAEENGSLVTRLAIPAAV
jgi:signal transduction histidine kinase